ncbi:MAG: hypothetical protein ACKVZJ_14090 [Phycisphaerales bacterium]
MPTSTPLAKPPNPDDLPHPITIFTTKRERSAILNALKRYDPDRRAALCKALNIKPNPPTKPPPPT